MPPSYRLSNTASGGVLATSGVGVTQHQLQGAVLAAEDVRDPERHRRGSLLAFDLHLGALDGGREGEIAAR
jgi:hypothetical protein